MANLRVDKITSTETFETTGSVQFDGSGDYLSIPDSTDFTMGTGDYTIEGWFYFNATGTNRLFGQRNSSAGESQFLGEFFDGHTISYYHSIGGTNYAVTKTNIISLQTWYHIAITRHNQVLHLYVNGVLQDTNTATGSLDDRAQPFVIGRQGNFTSNTVNGHISNFRIIKGQALYTSNFKPSMRELEVTAETVLLACQSKTDASLEKTGKTITVNGNAVANELTPGILTPVVKSGGGSAITGSVEFGGSSDYLDLTNSTDFGLSSSDDFTLELWIHATSFDNSSSYSEVIRQGTSNAGSDGMYFAALSAGTMELRLSGTTKTSTNKMTAGSWNHIAVCRDGGTVYIAINGITENFGSVTNSSTTGAFRIGADFEGNHFFEGHLSNVRFIKGTALYTSDFIPPTRELKKVPGTVLLCCQDENSVTTEVTGKTITGYGDLQRTDDVELITNGSFAGDFTGWSNGNPSQFTYSTDSVGGDTSGKLKYVASDSNLRTFTQYVTCVTGQKYNLSFFASSNASNAMVIDIDGTNVVTIDNNSNANLARYNHIFTAGSASVRIRVESAAANTAYFDNFSVKLVDGSNKGSNFTPQIGDDRQVTFEGVTKINTENYFYFPTGNTESRTLNVATQASSSARGLFAGGYSYGNPAGSRPTSDVIDYITISSTGDALDFGDLTESRGPSGGVASPTRGVWMHGDKTASPYRSDTIDYVTISSKGSAQDFGNTIGTHGHGNGNVSNSTRGICGGGNGSPVVSNNIEYITIATTGNGQDFGDLTVAKYGITAVSSPTRGVFSAGDKGPSFSNTMDYITIQSMGNALDFGDGIIDTSGLGGASNSIRGLFATGFTSPFQKIDYITIASTGNAQSFGDLGTDQSRFKTGTSSPTRAVFAGGYGLHPAYPVRDDIEYVTIMSLGNAVDFGNLTSGRGMAGGCSNGHGGLG